MTFEDIRGWIYTDLAEALTGNTRLEAETVNSAINEAYKEVAARTLAFVREGTIHTVASQSRYLLHPDMFAIRSLRYEGETMPLTHSTVKSLEGRTPDFRDGAAGTPERFYLYDMARRIGLYPKPSAAGKHITVEAHVLPIEDDKALYNLSFNSGGTTEIAEGDTIANATPTPTVTATVYEVHLVTGTWAGGDAAGHLYLYGQTGGAFTAGSIYIGASDVATITGDSAILDDTRITLVNNTDTPAFVDTFHMVLVHGAVVRLLSRFLMDGDGTVAAKIPAAREDYDRLVQDMLDYYASGVLRAPTPGSAGSKR